MTAPYVAIPLVIYEALEREEINREQFDIFEYGYWKARRPSYRVYSYSAEAVCLFRGVDATEANCKRYRRAAADLFARNLIQRDYYHIDPNRSDKKGRTYSIWLPSPEVFFTIGTAEENALSLWKPFVRLNVPDNVRLPSGETPTDSDIYEESQMDNVRLNVRLNVRQMSVTNQENQNLERNHPALFEGSSSPRPSPRGALAAGQNPHIEKSEALNSDSCDRLHEAAVQYANFSNWLYNFVPDTSAVTRLLRRFTPEEILFIQTHKFPLHEKVVKNNMAHFFEKGAVPIIEAGRLNGDSFSISEFEKLVSRAQGRSDFSQRWRVVLDAYEKVFHIGVPK